METTQDASNGGIEHGQSHAIHPPGGPDVWDSISLHNTTGSHRPAVLKRSQTLHPLKCGQSNEYVTGIQKRRVLDD
ncbi:hypothetical protein AAVH_07730 [Aphelenchoides avenae]|nr:hypothetical protein AAVH_07730 [Aphelenchus avenae]